MPQGIKSGGGQKGAKNRKTMLLEEKGREALAEVLGSPRLTARSAREAGLIVEAHDADPFMLGEFAVACRAGS